LISSSSSRSRSWAGDDWPQALEAVKRDLPRELRSYDPATRQWSCFVTADTQITLGAIFVNFWSALDLALHPQEALF
jgi:hypothetical protein